MSQTEGISEPLEPEVFDGATGLPLDTPLHKRRRRSLDLATVRGVRFEMAQLYRAVKRGKLPPEDASKMVYHLRQIGEMIVIGELEREIGEVRALLGRAAPEALAG